MTETTENLEKFIEKIKQDGVDAGRAEGEKIKGEAGKEAEKIIAEAKTQAEKIIEEAKEQAKQIISQGKTDLSLAARDVLLSLRADVQKTVAKLLQSNCENRLNDPNFLGDLIKSVVGQYVQADALGKNPTVIVEDGILPILRDSILAELSNQNGVALLSGLKGVGFDFISANGTLEVTDSSIAEVLRKYVSTELQEIMRS